MKGVVGDMRIHNGIGEISVALPEKEPYRIDASAGIGDVSSAFGGATRRRHLIGASLWARDASPLPVAGAAESAAPEAKRLYLRVGIGDINIKKMEAVKSDE